MGERRQTKRSTPARNTRFVSLGVPGLEAVLPQGIRAGSLILIVGPPGSGKTLLAMQLLMEMDWQRRQNLGAKRRKPAGTGLFLSADESRDVLERQRDMLLTSTWSRELKIDRLPSWKGLRAVEGQEENQPQDDPLELFLAWLNRSFPGLDGHRAIGLDGMANVAELRGASIQERRRALRETAVTLQYLMKRTAETSLAAVMTAELPTEASEIGVSQLEEYVADVVIRLGVRETTPGKVRRYLEVPKARYVDSELGQHSLCIMSGSEVEREMAAAATLGWSREAMEGIRKGVVVFPGMRWVRRRGTGPLSRNIEDALRSLRQHVSRNQHVNEKVREILTRPESAKVLATILRGWTLKDIKWENFGRQLELLFREAVRTGWQWPSEASVAEICSATVRPLRLAWAEQIKDAAARAFLIAIRDTLATAKPGALPRGEIRLEKGTIAKLRELLEDGFDLDEWSPGRQNAAVMALLEVLAMVEYRPRYPRTYCTFGVRGLDEMFGTEDGSRGVRRGSSTVIVGGPGTGKSMLAYCFMLQGLRGEPGEAKEEGAQEDATEAQEKDTERQEDVIFLSFDERCKRVLRDAGRLTVVDSAGRRSRTLSEMAASQILESDIRRAPEHPRFRFVYENPINADLDRLMHLLSREIASLAPSPVMLGGQERRRCRLIIDSLSDLERNVKDPRVFNDFVTTLLNKAIDCDVTALVVYEAAEDGGGKPTGRLLSFMADNVIVLQHVEVNNIARKSVRIRKARGRRHDPSVAELDFRRDADGSFHVEVRKGFEGMSKVLSGKPERARIDLRLFAENQPEEEWNDRFVKEIKALYPGRVRLVPFRLEQIRAAFWHRLHERDISPDADVTVVSMDQPWVRTLAEQESPLLSRWDPAETGPAQKRVVEDLLEVLRNHAACEPADRPEGQCMLALPLYHDIGLLLRRTDLPEGEAPVPVYWNALPGPGEEDRNARSMEGALEELLGPERDRLGPDVCGFAFDMDNVNTVACLFIEMCWGFGASEAFFVSRDSGQAEQDLDCATEALLFLARLRWRGLLPYPCTFEHCAKALYSRLWYANLPKLADLGADAANASRREPMAFPRGVRPLGAKSGSKQPVKLTEGQSPGCPCCCGAWYLGVLSSGGNANLGWSIVLEALDRRRIRDRAMSGAGLPPTESFYRLYGERTVPNLSNTTFAGLKDEFFPQAKSRMLAFGLGARDSNPKRMEPAPMEVLSTMPERLHELVMSVLGDEHSHPDKGDAAREFVRDRIAEVMTWAGANLPSGAYQAAPAEAAQPSAKPAGQDAAPGQ